MKLYHATKIQNIEGILEYGLVPQISEKVTSLPGERVSCEAVFGFNDIYDAEVFAKENWSDFVIFEFEVNDNEIKEDPEYVDLKAIGSHLYGMAYYIKTNEPINAKLVFNSEEDEEFNF